MTNATCYADSPNSGDYWSRQPERTRPNSRPCFACTDNSFSHTPTAPPESSTRCAHGPNIPVLSPAAWRASTSCRARETAPHPKFSAQAASQPRRTMHKTNLSNNNSVIQKTIRWFPVRNLVVSAPRAQNGRGTSRVRTAPATKEFPEALAPKPLLNRIQAISRSVVRVADVWGASTETKQTSTSRGRVLSARRCTLYRCQRVARTSHNNFPIQLVAVNQCEGPKHSHGIYLRRSGTLPRQVARNDSRLHTSPTEHTALPISIPSIGSPSPAFMVCPTVPRKQR